MRLTRAAWLLLKYYLAACGFVVWCALWFERSPWLGFAQVFITGPLVWAELKRRKATGRW